MQLFITNDFKENKKNIEIFENRVVYQLKKVLRASQWYFFYLQNINWKIRYKLEIIEIKQTIIAKILDKKSLVKNQNIYSMLISLPNNNKKLDLIVQKLSEIWVNNIYFWKSQRSIIKTLSKNRHQRLKLIALEAVEQSRWNTIPNIKFLNKISDLEKMPDLVFLFDLNNQENKKYIKKNNILGIIWPEWWFDNQDYELLKKFFWKTLIKYKLWENVLRMETASIIWAWIIKNFI